MKVEIDEVDNGYVVDSYEAKTARATSRVYHTLPEVIVELKCLFIEKEKEVKEK